MPNLASARVIEKAGGVLEDVRETELGLTRRYWITLWIRSAAEDRGRPQPRQRKIIHPAVAASKQ